MEKEKLDEKLKELNEVIRNFNNSKHNYSLHLEMYMRDFFDKLIVMKSKIKQQSLLTRKGR